MPSYKRIIKEVPNLQWFLDKAIPSILKDAKSVYKGLHEYVCIEQKGRKKVGYREHGTIDFTTTDGYLTLFACYKENVQNEYAYKGIWVSCGYVSYAEIPKNRYNRILGVTGTLSCLSNTETKIIKEDYKITKQTLTPSIYGASKLDFKKADSVFLEYEKTYYHRKIMEEIREAVNKKRAVLVVLLLLHYYKYYSY